VDAAKRAISRNKGRDWSTASGSVRAGYLRAIAAKVLIYFFSIFVLDGLKGLINFILFLSIKPIYGLFELTWTYLITCESVSGTYENK